MKRVKFAPLMVMAAMVGLASSGTVQADPIFSPILTALSVPASALDASPLKEPFVSTQSGSLSASQPVAAEMTFATLVDPNAAMPTLTLQTVDLDPSMALIGLRPALEDKLAEPRRPVRMSLSQHEIRLLATPKAKQIGAKQIGAKQKRATLGIASINPKVTRSYDLNINGGENRGKLFGTLSVATQMTKARNRWLDLETRSGNPMPACKGANCFAKRWQDIASQTKALPARQRLLHVNRSINKLITYKSDLEAFQSRDYWASPSEAYRNGGDCEDFAIAKYWMLREIGYQPNEMRLVVLRDTMVNQWHAVLAVRHGDDWAVLDNRFSRIRMSGEMPHLKPVYTVNEVGTWMQKPKTGKSLNQLVARK